MENMQQLIFYKSKCYLTAKILMPINQLQVKYYNNARLCKT